MPGEIDIVKAGHGDIAWDVEAQVVGGMQRADRQQIVAGHNRRGLGALEQTPRRIVAALDRKISIEGSYRIESEPRRRFDKGPLPVLR